MRPCDFQTSFKEQFVSSDELARYAVRIRLLLVRDQGWREARISPEYGLNTSGALHPIMPIIKDIIAAACGFDAIENAENFVDGDKMYSRVGDADTLFCYTE